jgi:DNA-binding NarL/FixJ family response regulator
MNAGLAILEERAASPERAPGQLVAPIGILVVDDHDIVRDGITALLRKENGIEVIGYAASGEGAVLAARDLRPDVVIMDLMLPDITGIVATRRILSQSPSIRIIVLSASHRPAQVHEALRAGARSYVIKEVAGATLGWAVRTVCDGNTYVSAGIGGLTADDLDGTTAPKSPYEQLSVREREVLHHVVSGDSSAEIGRRLALSRKTIDSYRSRLMLKLNVRNRSELIRLVIEDELGSAWRRALRPSP